MIKRNVFLDFWRGVALLFMICFHIVYDLNVFLECDISYSSGFWMYVRYAVVCIFIFVSGASIAAGLNKRIFYNAGKIALAAMLVSVGTYFFDSRTYVMFGILHFMTVCVLLSKVLLPLNNIFLVCLAVVIVLCSNFLNTVTVQGFWLLPLGIAPQSFSSVDYYSLVPWLGVFIFGIVYGKKFVLPNYKSGYLMDKVCVLGRHTLIIYLLHQPIIILLLLLFKKV